VIEQAGYGDGALARRRIATLTNCGFARADLIPVGS
jgi:hypothetical protein